MRRTFLTLLAALALAGGLAGPAAAAPPAAAPPTTFPPVYLQHPTGPLPTGTTLLHLRDESRVDGLDPAGGTRELMVQLWYPAFPLGARAPYAPPKEAAFLDAGYAGPGAFDGTTVSRLNAPPIPGRHKVILMAHGLCASRTDTTAINQQLASLGFVVAAIGATHESALVEFPGGRTVTTSDPDFCAVGTDPFSAHGRAVLKRLIDVRVQDASFVLDELTKINRGTTKADDSGRALPRGMKGTLDTRRVGMFGHSFGGGTAVEVAAKDPRVVAAANLDGFVPGDVQDTGLAKPTLFLGSDYHDPAYDPTWGAVLPKLTGWHRWLRYEGAGHYRFMDFGGSTHRWGLDTTLPAQDPEAWRTSFGDVPDERSQALVVRVTSAFFVKFLYGLPAPVLDRPSAFYPELVREI